MESLDKSKIVTLIKSNFNVKKANFYLVIWFAFVALLEVCVYFKHGTDYIVKNWVSVPVLCAGGVVLYLIFRYFNYASVKSVEKYINADNIIVLETKVIRVKKGGGLAELYFSSRSFGKHSVIVDEAAAEEAIENVTRYYLVLTKEKRKYNLVLALPAREWFIGEDLGQYKVCEL